MNVLDPKKVRRLYALFSYGHGVRESARLAGVNRNTATRYRREFDRVRPELQRAYDALWDHDCETCDAINALLPEPAVMAMLGAWSDDQDGLMPRSKFYDGEWNGDPDNRSGD